MRRPCVSPEPAPLTLQAGVSTQVFTTALVLNSAVFGAEVLLFLVLRKRFSSIYEPRTYKVAPK